MAVYVSKRWVLIIDDFCLFTFNFTHNYPDMTDISKIGF